MKAMNNSCFRASLGWVLGCLLFVAALRCEAQGNVVPNPSFEEYDTCHAVLGFFDTDDGPLHWFSGGGTPDYYQSCLLVGAANAVPQSFAAFQYAEDGGAYVGVGTFQLPNGFREYVMAELLTALTPGQTYYVSFYANAAWNGSETYPQCYIASSHIGALFTMQPRPWTIDDPWPVAGNTAQVYHPWVVSDTVGWTLVSGSFVADSAYQYLMIGNHFDNSITDTVHFAHYAWLPKAYTLIDNVCVSTDPLGCPMASGVVEVTAPDVVLWPNPAVDLIQVAGRGMQARAMIMDPLGRRIWQGNLIGESWRLDVGTWPRGSYVLRMEEAELHRSFKFVLTE